MAKQEDELKMVQEVELQVPVATPTPRKLVHLICETAFYPSATGKLRCPKCQTEPDASEFVAE